MTSKLPSIKPRVAFLCGKGGGDYLALERARQAGLVDYESVAFICTSSGSAALKHVREHDSGVAYLIADRLKSDRDATFGKIHSLLSDARPDWIFLCGFAFLLPASIVSDHAGRIINTHHALLPDHPGLFSKEWLVQQEEPWLGATVHLVDEGMDTGRILAQARFPNFGMAQFDRVLRYYRFVQDVLIVQVFRDMILHAEGERQELFSGIRFEPSVEMRIIEKYSQEHDLD